MLPTIVGVGFAGLLAMLGYFGKRAIEGFSAFRNEVREDIYELRTDVAVIFDRFNVAPASRHEREEIKARVVAR